MTAPAKTRPVGRSKVTAARPASVVTLPALTPNDQPMPVAPTTPAEPLVSAEQLASAEPFTPELPPKKQPLVPAQRSATLSPAASSMVSVDSVSDYLRQIAAVALLTAEQEVELAQRIEIGVLAAERLATQGPQLALADRRDLRFLIRDGEVATDHMLRANLRLVVSVAKRYVSAGLPLSDLIQEGNLGLIRAVYKFDHTKGFKFSTYATWWIRQAILRAVADQTRTIRVPVHMVDALNKLNRQQRELTQKLGREPTLDELAEQYGEKPEKIAEIRRMTRQPVSLDQPVGTDGETCLADLVATTSAAADSATPMQLRDQLESLLSTLNEREQLVLRLRCGLVDGTKHSFEQISKAFGKSRERIRHIETAALRKLRPLAEGVSLRDFLVD
jgi:RNA polymerase primary sigma factor